MAERPGEGQGRAGPPREADGRPAPHAHHAASHVVELPHLDDHDHHDDEHDHGYDHDHVDDTVDDHVGADLDDHADHLQDDDVAAGGGLTRLAAAAP